MERVPGDKGHRTTEGSRDDIVQKVLDIARGMPGDPLVSSEFDENDKPLAVIEFEQQSEKEATTSE
ncbi:hypothetical protein A2865_04580 [Candidatus Woesebacteria bacterium RIFCSPHIGHO2_01_FULL_39_17]|uniref:Uncharacterized protein n=3 Tax=Candidatus Woeseibacteriota TaxID=1752722 RepID=A0A0G0NDI9_9BACT|nr:MAG: hypothetical protein US72_C0005G0059 [Microgenomates group bacterium GW2011_GWC1_38_12]KKQ94255.1 MAG: hypothetical protein UT19_C0003G0060 [Candidatus Woesebacteria bacterium GW2011_GWB1_39_10b]KKR14194.1 MAG: hypothetical protein UT40_C0004G0017 [Candidatus Woesebacteria bacterium GW2011_GWA1_39_21b]OGM23127.1 MAG: hypothetical protein A2865_04580 [Candidatus Woesebacteria bacterium RIFCSPHIGHO2_01_FULL_39_17]OGM63490.1 MAG: hypothetical protein A3A52_05080 [Candidatus Woesebacteria b